MASEKDYFHLSGPLHLTNVNWENAYHRKSVAATLVKGVYVLEKDRQEKRKGPKALAHPWWTFFHFQIHRTLVDDVDDSIFGAIYEFKPLQSIYNNTSFRTPRYVIAFRGTSTIPRLKSLSRDIQLNLEFLKNGLHRTSRSEIAIKAVRDMVSNVGGNGSNIWLTGHSLGSGMALLAGKTMAKSGILLECFLFNPPYASLPIERIRSKKLKHTLRIAGSVVTAGLAIAMNDKKISSSDSFNALSGWIPSLFVNPSDDICSGYVGYFEHRRKMEEIGVECIEKIASQNSLASLLMSAFGKESEPLHLIPSCSLTENLTPTLNFRDAHGIHQWWKPDLCLKTDLYKY